MLHELIAKKLRHIGSRTILNQFLTVGELQIDKVKQPGLSVLEFRMVKESDATWLVEALPDVTRAMFKWNGPSTTGTMRVWVGSLPMGGGFAADRGGDFGGRTIAVKDLFRDLARDRDLTKNNMLRRLLPPKVWPPSLSRFD
jgi:hypothetical protein